MKKLLFLLLLLPILAQAQLYSGTSSGSPVVIDMSDSRYLLSKGSSTILVRSSGTMKLDSSLSTIMDASFFIFIEVTSLVGDVFGINKMFIETIYPTASGAVILTNDPKILFRVTNSYSSLLTALETSVYADTTNNWNILGNASTVQSTNFVGTTDSVGLSLRTNNVERFKIGATGGISLPISGIASLPMLAMTGSWYTGGSATTTKPLFLIEPTGTISTGWSTAGTGFGVNAPNTTNVLMDLQTNGVSRLKFTPTGANGASLDMKGDVFSFSSGGESVIRSNFALRLYPGYSSGIGYGVRIGINSGTATARLNIDGQTLTTTATNGCLDMAQTWNTSTNPTTAVKLNITNTLSHASSLLMDLQVGGSSMLKVSKSGLITTPKTIDLPSTGAAPTAGILTLVGGTATVNTTAMTSTALLFLQRKTSAGTPGTVTTYTQVNNTSFTVTSDNILDTSTYVWEIIETH